MKFSDRMTKKYSEYLENREKLTGVFYFGFITVLTTKNRIIILSGFLRKVISIKKENIEFLGYVTRPRWIYLITSLFMFATSHLFNLLSQSFILRLMGITPVLYLFAVAFAVLGLIFIVTFGVSLFGKLEIYLKEAKPIRLYSTYSPDAIALINAI